MFRFTNSTNISCLDRMFRVANVKIARNRISEQIFVNEINELREKICKCSDVPAILEDEPGRAQKKWDGKGQLRRRVKK